MSFATSILNREYCQSKAQKILFSFEVAYQILINADCWAAFSKQEQIRKKGALFGQKKTSFQIQHGCLGSTLYLGHIMPAERDWWFACSLLLICLQRLLGGGCKKPPLSIRIFLKSDIYHQRDYAGEGKNFTIWHDSSLLISAIQSAIARKVTFFSFFEDSLVCAMLPFNRNWNLKNPILCFFFSGRTTSTIFYSYLITVHKESFHSWFEHSNWYLKKALAWTDYSP